VTQATGSSVRSSEPSYLVAIRGTFTRRVPRSPSPRWNQAPDEIESYSVKVLVVEIKSGRITDSGGGPIYPEMSSVGSVVTDYRRSA
jgi:hypothetical protein